MAVQRATDLTTTNLETAIGGAPSAGDDVIVDAGSVTYDAGLDLSTNELNSLTFGRNFRGSIAQGGGVLVDLAGASDELVVNHSGGDVRIQGAGTGGQVQTAKVISTGSGVLVFTGGDLGDLQQSGGASEITSAATVSGTLNVFGSGRLTVRDHGSDTLGTVNLFGEAALQLGRDTTTVNQSGGTVTLNVIDAAVTTLNLNSGVFRHESDTGMTTVTVRDRATLDLRNVSDDITISTLITGLNSRVLYPRSFTVTITTHIKLANAEPLTA